MPVLCSLGPVGARRCHRVVGRALIGRRDGLAIQLTDHTVSREHATIESDGRRTLLWDLRSANGTWVNARRLKEQVELRVGDRVCFGSALMLYQTIGHCCRRKTRSKRLRIGGLFLVCLCATALAFSKYFADRKTTDRAEPRQTLDPSRECQALGRVQPVADLDWAYTEAVCVKALDQRPADIAAQALLRRVRLERNALASYHRAMEALETAHPEEALGFFAQIPSESAYFFRARSQVARTKEAIATKAKEECRDYTTHQLWSLALPRCETYVTIVCQGMSDPNGRGVHLERWESSYASDPTFARFFDARKRLGLADHPWRCPPMEILRESGSESSVRKTLERQIRADLDNPLAVEAVLRYWEGRPAESLSILQRLRHRNQTLQEQAMIESLRGNIVTAERLFRAGHTALAAHGVEKARALFNQAFTHDDRVMMGLSKSHPSALRSGAEAKLAARTYARGKQWADRKELRRACRVWKTGFEFSGNSLELSRALQFCSRHAATALAAVSRCSELSPLQEMSVAGDGLEEKIRSKRVAMKCYP